MSSPVAINPNEDLTINSLIYAIAINLVIFSLFIVFFYAVRRYKQIFLKRLQKRFLTTGISLIFQIPLSALLIVSIFSWKHQGRVPPEPPQYMFGWLVAILRIPEIDVLHMVGLDAYMLLRFHVLCLK